MQSANQKPPTTNQPTTTANQKTADNHKSWHQLSSTLLSSQGTDAHQPSTRNPPAPHWGNFSILLHPRPRFNSRPGGPVGSRTDRSAPNRGRSGQICSGFLQWSAYMPKHVLPSQGFRPRDQPLRATSWRVLTSASRTLSVPPDRATRRTLHGVRRSVQPAPRVGVTSAGIPTKIAGHRRREPSHRALLTTARTFFPRRSSTCRPCKKSPSSSTWSSEAAFTLLT